MNTGLQFHDWAREDAGFTINPFDGIKKVDRPKNGAARHVYWDFPQVTDFIVALPEGAARAAAALVLGAGVEEGALLAFRGRHILGGEHEHERRIVIPGTKAVQGKSTARIDRKAYLGEWAWSFLTDYAAGFHPQELLFPASFMGEDGKLFRDLWYETQVALGWSDEPPRGAGNKKLWGKVSKHTVHDGRHTYAIVRWLGLDGAPRRSSKWVAANLGHADEQMVIEIYGKTDVQERLRLIELREARESATVAATPAFV